MAVVTAAVLGGSVASAGPAVKEVHVVDWEEARCGSASVSSRNASAGHRIPCLQTAHARIRTRRWKKPSNAVHHPVVRVERKQEQVVQVAAVA